MKLVSCGRETHLLDINQTKINQITHQDKISHNHDAINEHAYKNLTNQLKQLLYKQQKG